MITNISILTVEHAGGYAWSIEVDHGPDTRRETCASGWHLTEPQARDEALQHLPIAVRWISGGAVTL